MWTAALAQTGSCLVAWQDGSDRKGTTTSRWPELSGKWLSPAHKSLRSQRLFCSWSNNFWSFSSSLGSKKKSIKGASGKTHDQSHCYPPSHNKITLISLCLLKLSSEQKDSDLCPLRFPSGTWTEVLQLLQHVRFQTIFIHCIHSPYRAVTNLYLLKKKGGRNHLPSVCVNDNVPS